MRNKFFKISKGIENTFETAVQKSEDFIEISKLNMKISSLEDTIEEIYIDIGKKIFKRFKSNKEVDKMYVDKCKEIIEIEKEIESIRKKVLKIKNRRLCKVCEEELDKDAVFCPNCGSKQ